MPEYREHKDPTRNKDSFFGSKRSRKQITPSEPQQETKQYRELRDPSKTRRSWFRWPSRRSTAEPEQRARPSSRSSPQKDYDQTAGQNPFFAMLLISCAVLAILVMSIYRMQGENTRLEQLIETQAENFAKAEKIQERFDTLKGALEELAEKDNKNANRALIRLADQTAKVINPR